MSPATRVFFDYAINFVLDAYILILMLRLLMQQQGVSWHNPIARFVVHMTNFLVTLFDKFGFRRAVDVGLLVVMWLLEVVQVYLLMWLKLNIVPGLLGLFVVGLGSLASKFLNIFFFATIIAVLISWIPTLKHNALAEVIEILAGPVMRLGRRFVPVIGAFDLSPLVVIIVLQLLLAYVVGPFINFGNGLALR